ncbi:MAG: regulatory protein GemA [Desulfobacula sp.]|nr:regulatory protein GemA [Desulfobacula sp.]
MISNGKKAAVHIAANQLGLTKTEYKDELNIAVGVRSSLKLTDKTFGKAMEHFKSLGYVGTKSKYFRIIENLPQGDRKMMGKINAIRLDLNLSWKYVDGIAKRVAKVDAVQWAKGEQLRATLQALIIHQKRKKVT